MLAQVAEAAARGRGRVGRHSPSQPTRAKEPWTHRGGCRARVARGPGPCLPCLSWDGMAWHQPYPCHVHDPVQRRKRASYLLELASQGRDRTPQTLGRGEGRMNGVRQTSDSASLSTKTASEHNDCGQRSKSSGFWHMAAIRGAGGRQHGPFGL